MFFFHRFGRHRHHHHHPFADSHFGDQPGMEGSWRGQYIIGKMAAKLGRRLDLDAQQQEVLRSLLHALQLQRESLKGGSARQEMSDLMGGPKFDREAAQSLLDGRIETLRAGSPAMVAALADFYDALDADQQQALRFMLRPRRHGHC